VAQGGGFAFANVSGVSLLRSHGASEKIIYEADVPSHAAATARPSCAEIAVLPKTNLRSRIALFRLSLVLSVFYRHGRGYRTVRTLKGRQIRSRSARTAFTLALRNTAKYCQFCTEQQYELAANACSWNRRIANENLRLDRGLAPSTDEPTSPKARIFTKTADKVWAGGKNLILVGGSGDIEVTGAVRETRWRMGGKKRSASGRDPISPGQNPNVDLEDDWETVSFRQTKSGFANPDAPVGETVEERDEEKRIRKLNREKDESSLVVDDE